MEKPSKPAERSTDVFAITRPEEEAPQDEKKNASERINLQQIMELREAFEIADTDGGGALDHDEFIAAFGYILGANMTQKELRQLFMRIDANASGDVDWIEFMNYMLLENQNLSSMKQENFEYLQSFKPDPAPTVANLSTCHMDMITCILQIFPEDKDISHEQFKRKMKYVTASKDGTVKIWNSYSSKLELTIKVTEGVWVTCVEYMALSKRLVAGSANRMISFYDLASTSLKQVVQPEDPITVPASRIEGLIGIPLCLDYHKWAADNNDGYIESLLCGDDFGKVDLYHFTQ